MHYTPLVRVYYVISAFDMKRQNIALHGLKSKILMQAHTYGNRMDK